MHSSTERNPSTMHKSGSMLRSCRLSGGLESSESASSGESIATSSSEVETPPAAPSAQLLPRPSAANAPLRRWCWALRLLRGGEGVAACGHLLPPASTAIPPISAWTITVVGRGRRGGDERETKRVEHDKSSTLTTATPVTTCWQRRNWEIAVQSSCCKEVAALLWQMMVCCSSHPAQSHRMSAHQHQQAGRRRLQRSEIRDISSCQRVVRRVIAQSGKAEPSSTRYE